MQRSATLAALGLALLPGGAAAQVDPEVLTRAQDSVLDLGFPGAVIIGLICLIYFLGNRWVTAQERLNAEKDARREDWKEIAAAAEAMRVAMTANTTALQSMSTLMQDRNRA